MKKLSSENEPMQEAILFLRNYLIVLYKFILIVICIRLVVKILINEDGGIN